MSPEQWQQLYHDAWAAFYSPEHLETVMRRSVATDSNAGNMTFLLLWYYAMVALEKIDPLEGGYLRRKYRKDRRPTLPVESPWVFYPRYVFDLRLQACQAGRADLALWRFQPSPEAGSRRAVNYTDIALTAVDEDRSEEMELATVGAGTKSPLVKIQSMSPVNCPHVGTAASA